MTYTENRSTNIFNHIATNAQPGDYFQLPQQPTFRVLTVLDLGESSDYITYIVQAGGNKPEQWDILKRATEWLEQERNRLEAEKEIEAYEIEMSEIIYRSSEAEIYDFDWDADSDWLTEPIGTNPDAIFGMTGEQQAEHLPPAENGYHDPNWTSDGCEF